VTGRLVSLGLWVLGLGYYVVCLVTTLALTYVAPSRSFDPILKAMMRGLFRLLFVEVRVSGLRHLPTDRQVIHLPAPHSSMLDVPLTAGFFPGYVRGIYAAGQNRWPLYGWVMRRLGNIPIERGDVHTSITTMRKADGILESGASLVIFPEGHRTVTGELLPFKKLPFHFAKEAGKPLVPVAIRGMFDVNNKSSWRVSPGMVQVRFCKAVSPEQVAQLTVTELRGLVEDRLRTELELPPGGSSGGRPKGSSLG
jgi:1-acyl-sn-glycerol-3-phosphate acyltransferase